MKIAKVLLLGMTYVPVIKETREHPQYAGRKSVDITDDYDCILIATHHDEYKDFDFSEFKAPPCRPKP